MRILPLLHLLLFVFDYEFWYDETNGATTLLIRILALWARSLWKTDGLNMNVTDVRESLFSPVLWMFGPVQHLSLSAWSPIKADKSFLPPLSVSVYIRSCKGFMHMKFTQSTDGRYVLGENSPPFSTIPEVIHYYTTHKLPIRGAEHMSLLYPVIVQTLWHWYTHMLLLSVLLNTIYTQYLPLSALSSPTCLSPPLYLHCS